jgi:hypothetical protein
MRAHEPGRQGRAGSRRARSLPDENGADARTIIRAPACRSHEAFPMLQSNGGP